MKIYRHKKEIAEAYKVSRPTIDAWFKKWMITKLLRTDENWKDYIIWYLIRDEALKELVNSL